MLLALLVCTAGLLIYILTPNEYPKVAEVGRIMFAFGLLVFLFLYKGGFELLKL